jgi:hypothetical protein
MLKKTVLPWLFLAVALTAAALVYRAEIPLEHYLFNSDALYMPTLFADIFGKGGRFSEWFLTPAPYFFPDYPLYLVSYFSGKTVYGQIFVFALLQVVILAVALFFVVRRTAKRYHFATTSLIVVALLWLAARGMEPYVYMFVSGFHFGAFLSQLAFVALSLHLERKGSSYRWATIGMCLLAFLTSLSDNIFLAQTTAPFLAATLLMQRGWKTGRRNLIAAGAALCAGALGSMSYRFAVTNHTRYPTKLGLEHLGDNAHQLLGIFGGLFSAVPLLGLVVLVYVCLGLACLVARARKRTFLGISESLATLVIFSLVSMAAMLVAILLVTNLPPTPRYLAPMLIWPIVVVVLVGQHLMGERTIWPIFGVTGLLAFSSLLTSLQLPVPTTSGYYPEQIACIDNALAGKSVHNGIAQYWDAKHIQAFSRQPITLAQYYSDLTPHKWITSQHFYHDKYDFAIVAEDAEPMYKLPVDLLAERNGPPAEKISCGTRTVLIYGANKLHADKISQVGNAYVWQGCKLPMQISKANDVCEAVKTDPAQEGFVTFGPYEALPAGEYAFDLTYTSSKPESEVAGQWDAVLALPTEARRMAVGPMNGTAGQARSVSGKFVVDKDFDMTRIEIRAFSNKGGAFKVASLRVRRTR